MRKTKLLFILFSVILLVGVLLPTNPHAEVVSKDNQKFELGEFMNSNLYNFTDDTYTYYFDNSLYGYDVYQLFDFAKQVFKTHPFGIGMNVRSFNIYGLCEPSDITCNLNIKFRYYDSKEDYTKYTQEVSSFSNTISNEDFTTKIAKISDYVKSLGTYDYDADTIGSPHSPVTLMNEGKGVCQAYATLTQRLLTNVGIENYLIPGYANGESHVWNVIFDENGNMYHLDLTWEDILNDGQYYMISTQQLDSLGTHIYELSNLDYITGYRQYKNGNQPANPMPPVAEPNPPISNPSTDLPIGDDLGGNTGGNNQEGKPDEKETNLPLPVSLEEFLENISNATYLGDLGVQPTDKAFSINFNSNVGRNFESNVFMYNKDTNAVVPIDFEIQGKSLIVTTKSGTMDKGNHYLVILPGVESDDVPPMITKTSYYISYLVQ